MLGPYYRITTVDSTGVALAAGAVTVKQSGWNVNSSGVVVWQASTAIYSSAALAIGGYDTAMAALANNGATPYDGATLYVTTSAPASSAGTISVYLEESTDGTTWPSQGNGILLANPYYSAAGVANFTVHV